MIKLWSIQYYPVSADIFKVYTVTGMGKCGFKYKALVEKIEKNNRKNNPVTSTRNGNDEK